jgi:putative FmdB family regulatory protein
MPIFEYLCRQCGKTFETFRKSADEVKCPQCGSPPERVVSVFSGQTSPSGGGGCASSGGFS